MEEDLPVVFCGITRTFVMPRGFLPKICSWVSLLAPSQPKPPSATFRWRKNAGVAFRVASLTLYSVASGSQSAEGPRVSVVVPNYNHAKFLVSRIESIRAQTYRDFELILLDDASTDDSREVLKPYLNEPNVRHHFRESNSGSPFVQWNQGVAMARGRYVWLAESDDVAAPTLLETLVRRLDAQPSVGLAYCESNWIDSNGAVFGFAGERIDRLSPGRWGAPFVASGPEECGRFLIWENTIVNASAVVFRKDVFLRAGGAAENLRLSGDWETWIRMLLISDLAFTPERLNFFRHHAATVRMTTKERRYLRELCRMRKLTLSRAPVAPATRRAIVADTVRMLRLVAPPRGLGSRHWAEVAGCWIAAIPLMMRAPRSVVTELLRQQADRRHHARRK